VKRSDLKELIREEIKKILSENIGKYEVEYDFFNKDYDIEEESSDIIVVDDNEASKNLKNDYFWEEKIREKNGQLKFPFVKVTKITKIG
jgi:hypothetical protein